jgi:hypothetical protein
MLLQYIHILFLPHDDHVKCTSPSCSKAPSQHEAATPVLHGWDGVLRLASLALFPPNITMVIMAKQLYFCFIRTEDISPKGTVFVPMCSLAFYGGFSSLLSGLSGYVDIGLVLLRILIFLYLFPPASSQGPLLLF